MLLKNVTTSLILAMGIAINVFHPFFHSFEGGALDMYIDQTNSFLAQLLHSTFLIGGKDK